MIYILFGSKLSVHTCCYCFYKLKCVHIKNKISTHKQHIGIPPLKEYVINKPSDIKIKKQLHYILYVDNDFIYMAKHYENWTLKHGKKNGGRFI